jgi:hypothetical protein
MHLHLDNFDNKHSQGFEHHQYCKGMLNPFSLAARTYFPLLASQVYLIQNLFVAQCSLTTSFFLEIPILVKIQRKLIEK